MWWSARGLAVAILAGSACGGGSGNKPDGGGALDGGGTRWVGTLEITQVPLDILFLIDESSSMKLAQDKLVRSFPTFMARLQGPPGPPSLHIAVVSQDMGAGDGSVAGCDGMGGKQGIFQHIARGACTATKLNAGATYIANADGVANYTGNIEDVFACIAALGETGCGFEHQLAAITRALGADDRPAPVENQGFLRPDAILGIIMLTNEDDCSVSPGVPLFDTNSNMNIASQLGPPANFRCNEFGHMCDGAHPNRNAPNNDVTQMVTYTSCESNDTEGYLLGGRDTADRLRLLKVNPAQVAVVSIQAPSQPYTVTWKAPGTPDSSCGAASCPWPQIAHSCTASDGSFGDPGVRTEGFVQQFGNNGLVLPICADDFAPSMDLAATLMKSLIGAPCLPGSIGAKATGTGPDCKVTEHYQDENGMLVDQELPACADNGDVGPCWKLRYELAACLHPALRFTPDPNVPPNGSETFTYDCARCVPGRTCYD